MNATDSELPVDRAPSESPRLRKLGDLAIALGLAFTQVVVLLWSVKDLGYTRDEGFYFYASSSYGRWFEQVLTRGAAALDPRTVDSAWAVNHEHPALSKALFALSNTFLQHRFHLFSMEGTSFRFPAMVLSGILIAVVYLWGAQARGRAAGIVAAVLLAAMPRFFFHSHLACFDVPIMTMWTLTAYAYWRSLREGGLLWPVLTGVAFGLSLDTKHNSWFLPFGFAAHFAFLNAWALVARTRLASLLPAPSASSVVRLRALLAMGCMAVIGPVVFYALWPWIWHDTVRRLQEYAQFHLHHDYYNMEFFGTTYWAPPMPRSYAWVMTLATVPVVTLALFAVGIVARGSAWFGPLVSRVSRVRLGSARSTSVGAPAPPMDAAATDALWLMGLCVNYVAWLSPNTPIFGGTKHWMTAYPFLALFAGAGFEAVARAIRREFEALRRRAPRIDKLGVMPWVPIAVAGVCVTAAPIVETAHSNLWGLSSYSPLVGGAAGGATLGLNRGFWGYTTGAVASWLNRRAPRWASVYLHDTAGQSWEMLLRDGRVRDLRATYAIVGSDYGLYHHEQHMEPQEYQTWVAYRTVRPAHIAGIDGVPVIVVYEHPRVAKRVSP